MLRLGSSARPAGGEPTPRCSQATHIYNFAAWQHEITVFDGAFTTDVRREGTSREVQGRAGRDSRGAQGAPAPRAVTERSPFHGRQPSPNVVNTGLVLDPTGRDGDFRKAALADGLIMDAAGTLTHGLTDYMENAWHDVYAEAFSIYLNDPDLLRGLRPTAYACFAGKFPR